MMREASTMCAGAVLLALVVSLAATADGRERQATYQDLTYSPFRLRRFRASAAERRRA